MAAMIWLDLYREGSVQGDASKVTAARFLAERFGPEPQSTEEIEPPGLLYLPPLQTVPVWFCHECGANCTSQAYGGAAPISIPAALQRESDPPPPGGKHIEPEQNPPAIPTRPGIERQQNRGLDPIGEIGEW